MPLGCSSVFWYFLLTSSTAFEVQYSAVVTVIRQFISELNCGARLELQLHAIFSHMIRSSFYIAGT